MDQRQFEQAILHMIHGEGLRRLKPTEVAYRMGVSLKEAERMLDRMVTEGALELDSDDDGNLFYYAPGAPLMAPPGAMPPQQAPPQGPPGFGQQPAWPQQSAAGPYGPPPPYAPPAGAYGQPTAWAQQPPGGYGGQPTTMSPAQLQGSWQQAQYGQPPAGYPVQRPPGAWQPPQPQYAQPAPQFPGAPPYPPQASYAAQPQQFPQGAGYPQQQQANPAWAAQPQPQPYYGQNALVPVHQGPEAKSPSTAAVLSMFFPGAGQVYNGQVGKGIMLFFATMFTLVAFPLGLLPWAWSIVDAYHSARRHNSYYGLLPP